MDPNQLPSSIEAKVSFTLDKDGYNFTSRDIKWKEINEKEFSLEIKDPVNGTVLFINFSKTK